jgi:hypothetical protein
MPLGRERTARQLWITYGLLPFLLVAGITVAVQFRPETRLFLHTDGAKESRKNKFTIVA